MATGATIAPMAMAIMARERLGMRLLPLDPILMLTLMAGDTGVDTGPTTMVTMARGLLMRLLPLDLILMLTLMAGDMVDTTVPTTTDTTMARGLLTLTLSIKDGPSTVGDIMEDNFPVSLPSLPGNEIL